MKHWDRIHLSSEPQSARKKNICSRQHGSGNIQYCDEVLSASINYLKLDPFKAVRDRSRDEHQIYMNKQPTPISCPPTLDRALTHILSVQIE